MGNSVGLRELRQRAGAVVRRVAQGEAVDVTDRGHPIAGIVPLRPSVIDQLVLEGRAAPAVGDLLDVAEGIGLPRAARGQLFPSDALTELRRDER